MSSILENIYWSIIKTLKGISEAPLNSTVIPFSTNTIAIDKTFDSDIILKSVRIDGTLKTDDYITVLYMDSNTKKWKERKLEGLDTQIFDVKINRLKITGSFGANRYGFIVVVYAGHHFSIGNIGDTGKPQKVIDWIETINIINTINTISAILNIVNLENVGNIENVELIESITALGTLNLVNTVNLIKQITTVGNIDTIGEITIIKDLIHQPKELILNANFHHDLLGWYNLNDVVTVETTFPRMGVGMGKYVKFPQNVAGRLHQNLVMPFGVDWITTLQLYLRTATYTGNCIQVIYYYTDNTSSTETLSSSSVGTWQRKTLSPTSGKHIEAIALLHLSGYVMDTFISDIQVIF